MQTNEAARLLDALFPGFLNRADLKSLALGRTWAEMTLRLKDFDPNTLTIPVPERFTYGAPADFNALITAVKQVDEDWVQYFHPGDRVLCAMDGRNVASFLKLDELGVFEGLRVGAPGCVGTAPPYRRQGIGLRLVQLATAALKDEGFDLSYIHFTGVAGWYARLGYETVLEWDENGLVLPSGA